MTPSVAGSWTLGAGVLDILAGKSVNHHTLAEFRVAHGEWLDERLTASVATLPSEGLVDLRRVAQDGVRVRASAGAASFPSRGSARTAPGGCGGSGGGLAGRGTRGSCGDVAKAGGGAPPSGRGETPAGAEGAGPGAGGRGPRRRRGKGRVSTTAPDWRVMKMADGGFRPAFNGQFATDTATQVIVGVSVSNVGSDLGQAAPMVEQIHARQGTGPQESTSIGRYQRVRQRDRSQSLAPPIPRAGLAKVKAGICVPAVSHRAGQATLASSS